MEINTNIMRIVSEDHYVVCLENRLYWNRQYDVFCDLSIYRSNHKIGDNTFLGRLHPLQWHEILSRNSDFDIKTLQYLYLKHNRYVFGRSGKVKRGYWVWRAGDSNPDMVADECITNQTLRNYIRSLENE